MRLIVPIVLMLVAGFFGYDYMTKHGGGMPGTESANGPSGSGGSSSLLSGFFGGSNSRSAPRVSTGTVSTNPFVNRPAPPEPEDAPPEPEDVLAEPEDVLAPMADELLPSETNESTEANTRQVSNVGDSKPAGFLGDNVE